MEDPNPDEPGVYKSKLLVTFVTAQTNAGAVGTLSGITTAYAEQVRDLSYMMDETYLTWSSLSAGDYCLEIEVPAGAKYAVSARTEALL